MKNVMTLPAPGDLRVWHIAQVPGPRFFVPVKSEAQAALVMRSLADYDAFQLKHRIKPDYCNAQGLERFEDGDWYDWYDVESGEDDVEQAMAKPEKRGATP